MRCFSPLHRVEIGTDAHLALYSIGTRVSCPGVKQLQCEVDYSPPFCAEVKNDWSYTFSALLCFNDVDSENFYLYLESTGE